MSNFEFNGNDNLIHIKERQIRNVNLIQFFSNYPVLYTEHLEGLTLMVGKSDKPWVYFDYEPIEALDHSETYNEVMISKYKAPMETLLSHLPPEYNHFAVIENWMEPLIVKEHQIYDVLRCKKLYMETIDIVDVETQLRAYSEKTDFEISNLEVEDAEFIQRNHKYSDFTDTQYIQERIQKGIHAGIRKNGELVAWVMTHDDGAIGFLFVLPEYRGMGLAEWLTQAMLYRLYESKLMPFVHVEQDNLASMSLTKKIGFKEAFDVSWFSLK